MAEVTDLSRNENLKAALGTILDNPSSGKALKEDLQGLYSFRVGSMRIIYAMASNEVIEIITIGPRRTVYMETYKLLGKE